MIRTIADFDRLWQTEMEATQKIFKHLTTKSLTQEVHPDVRTLGRLAWHIVASIPEMGGRTGLTFRGPAPDAPVPKTAKEIFDAYNVLAISLLQQVKNNWKDETLLVEDDMYGEKWARGLTLHILAGHQIHHRAQMTVVMRLLGLSIPGIYGPAKEEWASFGTAPPAI
jgi:uncharacterized damage-inducible protein DinB